MLSPPSHSNTLENDRILACSSKLRSGFSSCPSDLKSAAISAIPIQLQQCDNSEGGCIDGDLEYPPKKDYYTIFDVDNQETVKFEITVYPDVYDESGNLIIRGSKSGKSIQPIQQEVKITRAFHELSIARKNVIDYYNLKINNDGSITDATGQHSSSIPRSALSCSTAWDYKETDTTCRGDLNKDIEYGVTDSATFFAFKSSFEKLQTVLKVITPVIDLSKVGDLFSFNVKLLMGDDSVLVIDFEVDGAAVRISLNENASFTTIGQTFKQTANGVAGFYSLEEASSVAKGTAMAIDCRPSDPRVLSTWKVVKTITTNLPDGTERVTFIYKKQNIYKVYKTCN
ncbi:MAG: hypothetical protein ACI9IT_002473 [Glaciecola sp.]|jgi:hypothetical protein